MRRCIFVISIVVMLMSSGVCYAADALYRMLHADEVESFQKDQDAIIVGKLAEKKDEFFSVQVLKVVSGRVESDLILLSDNFDYGWSDKSNLPSVGDFCVMSLKKTGGTYKRAWGIFQADSGDYRTLRLTEANASSSGMNGDLAVIQWYVNSGGKEKDFSFEGGSAYVKRPNGEVVQIFPTSDDLSGKEDTFNDDPSDRDTSNEDINIVKSKAAHSDKNQITPVLTGGVIGVAIVLIVTFLYFKRSNK